ncbi:hypothetical protein BY458DRAFT_306056 [Sporodiniella umbellata]|nr:hypothetical protein BY458DRAFT_306056 [Sporodiniella umbellata]
MGKETYDISQRLCHSINSYIKGLLTALFSVFLDNKKHTMSFLQEQSIYMQHKYPYFDEFPSSVSETGWHAWNMAASMDSALSETDDSEVDQIIEDGLHYLPPFVDTIETELPTEESTQPKSENIQHLKEYLTEDNKDSLNTFSTAITEAASEGFLPFGSHSYIKKPNSE